MPTTPFSIIYPEKNPAGVRCKTGTPAQRIDLETLYNYITSQPRRQPPADKEAAQSWKGKTFAILLDVKARWSARDVPAPHADPEHYIIIDVDGLPSGTAEAARDALALSPFCVLAARSATGGVWSLMRAKVPEKQHFVALKWHCVKYLAPAFPELTPQQVFAYIDDSTTSPGRLRYVAFDPEAKRGLAFANPAACFCLTPDYTEATDAQLTAAPLYDLAAHLNLPIINARGVEGVCRSSGMAYALAGVAVAAPVYIDVGNKAFTSNLALSIGAGSSTGKSVGLRRLKNALNSIANTPVRTMEYTRTPQSFFAALTEQSCTKEDGAQELKAIEDQPSYLFSQDEAGAKRQDDKRAGVGVGTFDAYIRQAIDGEVQVAASLSMRGEVYTGAIPFRGAFVQGGTVKSVANAQADDDTSDGRERRTLYFVQEDATTDERFAADCMPQDTEENTADYLARKFNAIALFRSPGFGRISFDPAAADILRSLDILSEGGDERCLQLAGRIAAANALLRGGGCVTLDDLRVGLRIYAAQKKSKETLNENIEFQTKDPRTLWQEALEARFQAAGGTVSGAKLRQWRILRRCPATVNGKIGVRELWSLGYIQPATPEDAKKKTPEANWKLANPEKPLTCPDTAPAVNVKAPAAAVNTKPTPEYRAEKYIEKKMTAAAQEIATAPEGTRHTTTLRVCANLAPDLRAAGVDVEAGLRGVCGGSTLPPQETEDIITFVLSGGKTMTPSPTLESILNERQ